MRQIEPAAMRLRDLRTALATAALVIAAVAPCSGAPFAYIPTIADSIVVVDTSTDAIVATIPVGQGPYGVAVDPHGNFAYVSSIDDNSVSVIDAHTNTVVGQYRGFAAPTGIAVAPDGTRLYVLQLGTPGLVIIDTASMSQVGSATTGIDPVAIAIDPSGTRVYLAHLTEDKERFPCFFAPRLYCDITLWTIDLISGQASFPLPVGDELRDVVVHPDGTRVYVSNLGLLYGPEGNPVNWTARVSVIDILRSEVIANINLGANSGPGSLVLNPSGSRLYANGGGLWMIDTQTNAVIMQAPVGGGGLDITPDGTRLFVPAGTQVKVLDAEDLQVIDSIALPRAGGATGRFIGPDVPITPPLTATFTKTPTPSETPTMTATPSSSPTSTGTASRTRTATRTTSSSPGSTATPPAPTSRPTPTQKSTYPGDANCDSVLEAVDVGATITAVYDPLARTRCNADCNRDGQVNGSDVVCVIRALSAP